MSLGLAMGVILMEIGLVERRTGVLHAALILPAILTFLTRCGHRADPTYQWFLGRFIARLGGTPLYLTLLASAGFYAYAMVRGVPLAFDALTAAMVLLGFVAPQTLDLDELVPPRALPIPTAAVLQTASGLRRRDAWRCLIGAGGLAAPALIALPATGAGNHEGPIAFHLILATVLVVGAAFDDRLGRVLRAAGAAMALLASIAVLSGRFERTGAVPTWAMEVYPLAMAMAIAGYGFMLGHRTSCAAAGLILAAWLVAVGCRGYGSLRRVVTGLDYIAIGLVFFSLAVLTSMAKGGALPRRILDHKEKIAEARE